MKITKRLLAITLVVVILFAMSFPSFAVSENDWAKLWSSADAKAGIIMFVGSDEGERNFSWYSEAAGDPTVTISTNKSLKNPKAFVGSSIDAVEGGVVNKVTVTDLKEKGYDVKFSDFYR